MMALATGWLASVLFRMDEAVTSERRSQHGCKMGLDGDCLEASWLALSVGALIRLAPVQEPGGACGEAGGGRGLEQGRGQAYISPAMRCYCAATGARTMTIKTVAVVVGILAIIVVMFFVTKITTPSRLVAKSGFFAGSSTDDWGRGTGATGFWEPIRVEGRQEQMPQ